MKKGKRLAREPSPGLELLYPVAVEVKTRRRHEILWEDYLELIKENEARKEELQKAKQRKLKLLAEVKFLRRKYKILSMNQSREKTCKVKKKPQIVTFQFFHTDKSSNIATQSEITMNDQVPSVREYAFPITSTVIDLNQVSMPNGEYQEESQVSLEPFKVDKLSKCSTDDDTVVNDLKFPVCRDVGSGASRVQKRNIAWQDQLALKV